MRRGISPIIAVLFLIVGAVMMGVLFITWQRTWVQSAARSADIQIAAEILRASQAAQVNIEIKNVGTVVIVVEKIEITVNDTVTSPTLLGAFEGASWSSGADALIVEGLDLEMSPGDIASGAVRVSNPNVWKSGSSYLITITYKDKDRGNVLSKTVNVQA